MRYCILLCLICVIAFAQAPRPPIDKLSKLQDVHISSPVGGQVLTYDALTGKWINATIPGVPTATPTATSTPTATPGGFPSTDLTSYYKLDEATGTTRIDATGNGNNLTDNNTVVSAVGKISNCASFVSSSSQSLTAANAGEFTMFAGTSFTVSCWVKFTGTNKRGIVIYGQIGGTGYGFYCSQGSGTIASFISDGSTALGPISANSFNDGNWHLVMLTVDRSSSPTVCTLYVDNVSEAVDNGATIANTITETHGLSVGAGAAGTNFFMDGAI